MLLLLVAPPALSPLAQPALEDGPTCVAVPPALATCGAHLHGRVLSAVSDNAASISSYLGALDPATSAVTLGANLVGGGDSWTMTLAVTNYLNLSSRVATFQARRARPPRAARRSPTDAPPAPAPR